MKRLVASAMTALFAVLVLSTNADAQNRGRNTNLNINAQQQTLQTRISRGISTGRLSQKEAARLQAKFSQISQIEARMRSSGNRLSASERSRLQKQLSSLSAQINRELNDFERRRSGHWNQNTRRFR